MLRFVDISNRAFDILSAAMGKNSCDFISRSLGKRSINDAGNSE